jgi:ArsR family transcriptional regulator
MPLTQIAPRTRSRTVLARRFHALSDPTRLRLLELLATQERCVCDLQDAVGAGQSLLSFHLKALKDAGLVTDRRAGRWVYYAIAPDAFAAVDQFVEGMRQSMAQPSDCVC